MRTPILLILSILFSAKISAQQINLLNNLLLGYQEFPTTISSHTGDAAGNQYFTGTFRGQLQADGNVLAQGRGLEDVFWIKTNVNGQVLSHRTFGTSNTDHTWANSMAMGNNSMLFSMRVIEPVTIGNSVYPIYPQQAFANCLINVDTAGNVLWVRRMNLPGARLFFLGGIYHVMAPLAPSTPAVRWDNSVILDSAGRTGFVHIMVNNAGQVLNVKTMSGRSASQNVSIVGMDRFADGKLFLQVQIVGDSLILVNNSAVSIPAQNGGYYAFIKLDTAYANPKVRIVNPLRHSFGNMNLNPLPVCKGANDSLYVIVSYEVNTGPFSLDGFSTPPRQSNLYVFDSSFTVRRMVPLSSTFAGVAQSNQRRRLFFRNIAFMNGQLYLNGMFVGVNEAQVSSVLPKDTIVQVLPGVMATVDQNGPSRSFIARCTITGQNGVVNWYGDHRIYEDVFVWPTVMRATPNNRLVFFQNPDNTWNPFFFDGGLNRIRGAMRRLADMPDVPFFVRYFPDGSRVVIGAARGRTTFDSGNVNMASRRSDVFVVRLRANNQVVWYKRLASSLSAGVYGAEVRNNRIWFLVNYSGAQNESNFINVENTLYNVGTSASLLASIDTAGNLSPLNLLNPILQQAVIQSFQFFSNGDVAIMTNTTPISYQGFPMVPGTQVFRINPSTGSIISGRKLYGAQPCQPINLRVDSRDQLYGTFIIAFAATDRWSMHDGTSVIDTLSISTNGPSRHTLIRFNFTGLQWAKSIATGNAATSPLRNADLVLLNDRPVLSVFSMNFPTFWGSQLVHNGLAGRNTVMLRIDSTGILLSSKVINNFLLQTSRVQNNRLFASGNLFASTQVDTISFGFSGTVDGMAVALDSALKARRSFRIASPYQETLNDWDSFQDSLVSFAYMAQTNPQVTTSRTSVADGDLEEDAYLGDMILRSNVVTSVSTPLPRNTQVMVLPNPLVGRELRLLVKVPQPLYSVISVYNNSGQMMLRQQKTFLPGAENYVINLPAGLSRGMYQVVIQNQHWTTAKSFLIH
jgi:hypothetical protein